MQGVAGTDKHFGDPLQAALRWQEAGSQWLHLVDLDAAFGEGNNAEVIAEMVATVDMNVELTGGIRDDATLERALSTGCTRVNIGTAALENPGWCEEIIQEFGERIAISLDVKGERLAARGWTSEGGNVYELIDRLDAVGCARYVLTDVASDGMMQGPNLPLLGSVCARTDAPVVASGGVATLGDLRQLAGLVSIGVEGAIIGTALYEGTFTVQEALELTRGIAADLEETK